MSCPNTNSPEWKALVGKIGVFEAMREFIKNNEEIPSAELYPETFKGVNATLKIVAALQKSPRSKYSSIQTQGFYNDLKKYGAPQNQIDLLQDYIQRNNISEINTNDLIVGLLSEMNYTIEIETAREKYVVYDDYADYLTDRDYHGDTDAVEPEFKYSVMDRDGNSVFRTNDIAEAERMAKEIVSPPSSYYDNLTVPGGTNYTENEIRTPAITPSIKGHGRFSTDQGIGWFRSDDQRIGGISEEIVDAVTSRVIKSTHTGTPTKTRRILEVQSDLFQKGRGQDILIPIDKEEFRELRDTKSFEEAENKFKNTSQNEFLQLLNKDNNWVTFFVKSIIQDSAKKGYEKVLFPVGDTALKIEGHQDIATFISQREASIKSRQSRLDEINSDKGFTDNGVMYTPNNPKYKEIKEKEIERLTRELTQFRKEVDDARAGRLSFSAIANFYESNVFNILKKQGYNPNRITDEYNNGWYEVNITPELGNEIIYFQTSETSSTASSETVKKVKEFLRRIGVDFQSKPYLDLYGRRVDGNGIARLMSGIVEVVEGKENIALVEEAMHFATYIIQQTNPSLYNQMLNRISNYNIYRQTLQEYQNNPLYQRDGKPDIPKIKFEAIGKLLGEYFVQSEEGLTEKPELLEQRKNWIQRIIDWFKGLFSKNFNPFQEAISQLNELPQLDKGKAQDLAARIVEAVPSKNYMKAPMEEFFQEEKYSEIIQTVVDQLGDPESYRSAVRILLNNREDFAQEILNFSKSSTFLQTNNQGLVDKLDKTATEVVNQPTADGDNAYFINGQQVKNRVTRWIKKLLGDRFKDRKVSPKQKDFEDQMKEWGSRGHRDMQNLFARYLTSEGKVVRNNQGQLVAQNNNPIQSELDPNNRGLFDQIHAYVVDLLLSYPTDTIFRTEQTIYSSRGGKVGERDIAGTMDLIILRPDGKTDILDWKFVRINTETYSDIAWYKQNEWNLQMLEYKKILKRDYGLKDSDFGKTRMIPFVLEYNKKTVNNKTTYFPTDLEVADVNLKIDEKTYLLPVATPDESTGNQQLDKLIRSLTELYNTIKDIPAPERQRNVKNEQLNKIFAAIRHLQVARNFEPLTEQIGVLVKETERVLENHSQVFENLKDKTEQQISDEAANLLLKAQALHIYRNLDVVFRNFYGDKPSTEEAEILKKLHETVGSARYMYDRVEETVKSFGEKYISSRRGIENLLSPEKSVTGLTRNFNTTSELPTSAARTLFLMIDNANNKIQFDVQEAKDQLVEIKKKIDKWGGLKKALPLLKKEKENKLIDEYDSEFYTQLKKAVESKDTKWITANIDIPAFHKFLKQKYVEELEIIDNTIYSSDDLKDQEKRDQEIEKLENITDPQNPAAYLEYYNVKKFPKDTWKSKEYKELEKNPELLSFYNFVRKWNKKAHDMGYLTPNQAERNFLPYIYKSFSEKIALGGEYSFGDWLVSSLTVDENVAGYGNYNPLTEQMEDTIPTYFTREIDNPEQVSEDLFVNMAAYVKALINYQYKTEIDGQVRALYFIEQNKESLQVNQHGNLIRVNGQPVTVATNDKNAELLLNHIKSLQYGQKYTNIESTDALLGSWAKGFNGFAEKANKALGFKIIPKFPENSEGKQVSATRLMDSINRFFTIKNMGLNIATSASVFAGGNFQAIINSGKYYKKREFLASEFQHAGHKVFNNEKTHLALIKTFMPIDTELQREINKLSATTVNSNNISDFMMSLMRNADHIVQYSNFLAFMKNTIVVDGKLYNAREYYRGSSEYSNRYNLPEGERSKLENSFESKIEELIKTNGIINKSSVDKDGNLKIEGVPNIKNDNVFKYRTLITTVGRRATGNVSPENEMLIRMNAIYRSMLVFRNWIPGLVKQRFGGLRQDTATGSWEYGRVRMIMKHLGPLALLKIKNINDIIKGNEEGVTLLKDFFQKQKESYENKTDKELDMTEAEFMDMFRQALRGQIKELFILLSLIGMVVAVLPMFKPDDDEEAELKNRYKFVSRMFDKVKDEVWFYYNPVGLQQILNGSIFPALGIFTDAAKLVSSTTTEIFGIVTGDEELTEKTYPLKNLLKSLPITKEFIYYLAMYDADLAKEMGIQLTAQSRMR